ncbi:MAG: hypothetical protein FWC35_07860 [Proteobacteria bacterium]|nr:hypothetical protein [Pseudomonadota bacterium]
MKTKIFLAYLRSFAHMLIMLCVAAVGLVVVPVAVLCMTDNHLPRWAWWWGNDKDGDSDDGWRTVHYHDGAHTGFWPRFIWFAVRNPCYNFTKRYGAVRLAGRRFIVIESGDPYTTNRDSAFDGRGYSGTFRRVLVFDDGQVIPMYYHVRQWGDSGVCLRVLLGYKLMGRNIDGEYVEPVFNINPLMGFEV